MGNLGQTFHRIGGSGSLHGKDWANIGAMLAAVAVPGAGMAGMGPMAGMMGGGAGGLLGGAGAAGAAGSAVPTAGWMTGAGLDGIAGDGGLLASGSMSDLLGGGTGAFGGMDAATGGVDTMMADAAGGNAGQAANWYDPIKGMFNNQYGGQKSTLQKFALQQGKQMLGGAFGAQQPQQAPQPFRPPGMDQAPPPSSAQTLSGVYGADPQTSMANLTPEQRQMLLAMMSQGH